MAYVLTELCCFYAVCVFINDQNEPAMSSYQLQVNGHFGNFKKKSVSQCAFHEQSSMAVGDSRNESCHGRYTTSN